MVQTHLFQATSRLVSWSQTHVLRMVEEGYAPNCVVPHFMLNYLFLCCEYS